MSDIVERLRASKYALWKDTVTGNAVQGPTMLESEAADEIERLRDHTQELATALDRLLSSIHVLNSGSAIPNARKLLHE